jgi:hypothetical protein
MTDPKVSSQPGIALSYHHYLWAMDCLKSGDAKRRWRKAIKDAWDNRCCFCGQPPISDKSLTIDHLKPRSKGGEDVSTNCLPACLEHNQAKGSQDWKPWFRDQSFYDPVREARIEFWLKHGRVPTQQELFGSDYSEPHDA